MLGSKLQAATFSLKKLTKAQASDPTTGSELRFVPKAIHYSFRKESLDEAIEALDTWQQLADPSWFLLMRMKDRRIDQVLEGNEAQVAAVIPSHPRSVQIYIT